MAVLDSLPGVEVTVIVDGKDLHEYQDSDLEDDEDTVTKYIEAVDGANFAVKINVSKEAQFIGNCLSFKVLVDGSFVGRPLVDFPKKRKRPRSRIVDGVQVGPEHIRKLTFNALETVTEHGFGLSRDLDRVKNLGKIEICVTHQNKTHQVPRTFNDKPDFGGGNFISEKAIKGQAVTHSYSLDRETYSLDGPYWDIKRVAGTKNPVATFEFRYRSKAALKELMIIPRTPSPVPIEDRAEEDLSREEMAELLRRYRANASSTTEMKKELKREREDDNDNSNPRAGKRACSSTDPVHLELNEDDTFTEVAVAPKEKTIITLDD